MTVSSWVSSSLVRHYPATPPPKINPSPVSIEVALNERFSFQVVMRADGEMPQQLVVIGRSGQQRALGMGPVARRNPHLECSRARFVGHLDPLDRVEEPGVRRAAQRAAVTQRQLEGHPADAAVGRDGVVCPEAIGFPPLQRTR